MTLLKRGYGGVGGGSKGGLTQSTHYLCTYLLTYAHRSRWSIGHLRPLTIAHCSGLPWPVQSSWSLVASAVSVSWLRLSRGRRLFLFPCGFQAQTYTCKSVVPGQGLACGAGWCVRSSPTSSAVSAWPLVPVPLACTDLHFGSSPAIGFCRYATIYVDSTTVHNVGQCLFISTEYSELLWPSQRTDESPCVLLFAQVTAVV